MSELWAFIKLVPALYGLYNAMKNLGVKSFPDFIDDVLKTQKTVEASLDPKLSNDEKIKLRREALRRSADDWAQSIRKL